MVGLIVGALWTICAVFLFWKREKKYEGTDKAGVFLGIFFLIFGICGLLGHFLQSDILILTSVILAIALLCIGLFGYSVWMVNNCRTAIYAEYVRYVKYHGKGATYYAPVFKYRYMGQEYEHQCYVNYSMRKLKKLFTLGQTYQIWIDENNPYNFVPRRKVEAGSILVLMTGIAMLWIYAWLAVRTLG